MSPRLLPAAALLLALGLAGCGGSPPQTFAPLNYSYLPPITLKVAAVNVVNSYATDPDAAQLLAEDPAPPAAVLGAELARRLIASGAPGAATVSIEDASVDQANGTLNGVMTVRIDIASADGASTGFTEASVSHSAAAPGSDSDMPAALYDMTKQLMDAMNVQLQYHVQHDLSGWVVTTSNDFGPNAFGGGGFNPTLPTPPAGGAILAAPLAAPAGAAAPSAPQRLVPPNVAPPGVAPPGVAPPGVAPPGVAPPGVAPPGVAPPGVAPPGVAPLPGQTLQLPPSYVAPTAPPAYVPPPAPPPLSPNPTAPQSLVPY